MTKELSNLYLEIQFTNSDFGLSACRLWEHTELGQINVFSRSISARNELNLPASFIDVIEFTGETFTLLGLTLEDLFTGNIPENFELKKFDVVLNLAGTTECTEFASVVARHLDLCSRRQALRNQHHQFLPTAKTSDVFGIPYVHSKLHRLLLGMGNSKALAGQWLKTIDNFQKKGLRLEELERAGLASELMAWDDENVQVSALMLLSQCDFDKLRFSVIPVVQNAKSQLRFVSAPERALKKTKIVNKVQTGQTRSVSGFDPVLGYRIEHVEHQTLWGDDSHWQAVTNDGQVVRNINNEVLFQSQELATTLASSHAKLKFPKRLVLGQFGKYAWTGGKEYREWLITLPYYPASYLSGHFEVRNVLAHIRCDLREGADGERILMLQEVQSDWAQQARRALRDADAEFSYQMAPPFMKEWPALVMKLVLLHAAYEEFDAVTWTKGAHQVLRYKGLGAVGLKELYDHTLPREVNGLMKPFGGLCETLGVFVPTNFGIKQTEKGYEVYSPEHELLGIAPRLEDARQYVPDGAHELLYEVHGVKLSKEIRKSVLIAGFSAWG